MPQPAMMRCEGDSRACGWRACPSQFRWRSTVSAAGSARCSSTWRYIAWKGIRFYIRLKTVTARWPTGIRAGTEYIMRTDALKAPTGAQ